MKKTFNNNRRPQEEQPVQEIQPQDGLTVLEQEEEQQEVQEAEVVAAVDENDPLPSVPVQEAPVAAPVAAPGAMLYKGTTAMSGMVGRGGSTRVCALPVVVKNATGQIVGVLVVGEPGDITDSLGKQLETAGHLGAPFELVQGVTLDRQTKLAAARAIAAQNDPTLDRHGALMALGYTAAQLA